MPNKCLLIVLAISIPALLGDFGRGIDAIIEADFLSDEQKRDVLYNNAARFLRLSEEEIARHHGE